MKRLKNKEELKNVICQKCKSLLHFLNKRFFCKECEKYRDYELPKPAHLCSPNNTGILKKSNIQKHAWVCNNCNEIIKPREI